MLRIHLSRRRDTARIGRHAHRDFLLGEEFERGLAVGRAGEDVVHLVCRVAPLHDGELDRGTIRHEVNRIDRHAIPRIHKLRASDLRAETVEFVFTPLVAIPTEHGRVRVTVVREQALVIDGRNLRAGRTRFGDQLVLDVVRGFVGMVGEPSRGEGMRAVVVSLDRLLADFVSVERRRGEIRITHRLGDRRRNAAAWNGRGRGVECVAHEPVHGFVGECDGLRIRRRSGRCRRGHVEPTRVRARQISEISVVAVVVVRGVGAVRLRHRRYLAKAWLSGRLAVGVSCREVECGRVVLLRQQLPAPPGHLVINLLEPLRDDAAAVGQRDDVRRGVDGTA